MWGALLLVVCICMLCIYTATKVLHGKCKSASYAKMSGSDEEIYKLKSDVVQVEIEPIDENSKMLEHESETEAGSTEIEMIDEGDEL